MIDTDKIKRQHNIVDVIGRVVDLKRNGKNHVGLCPFHNEKTPSFTVEEDKQFYHCFGCGASGDVITFVSEYENVEFIDAANMLGAELEQMPMSKIAQNEKRKVTRYRLPPDHVEDAELYSMAVQSLSNNRNANKYYPLANFDGEIKNIWFEGHGFILGAPSYDCFYSIVKNDQPKWLAVESLAVGNAIASKYDYNVAVCFSANVLDYVCRWNNAGNLVKPVFTENCDKNTAYHMNWLLFDGQKLTKQDQID